MDWTQLTTLAQLDEVDAASQQKPLLIFKHSTRCNISATALGRLERSWTPADNAAHAVYHLDLLAHRDISDAIATRYNVEHESPQILVIRNGECVHMTTHLGITYADSVAALTA